MGTVVYNPPGDSKFSTSPQTARLLQDTVDQFEKVIELERNLLRKSIRKLERNLHEADMEVDMKEEELLVWEEKLQQVHQNNERKVRLAKNRTEGTKYQQKSKKGASARHASSMGMIAEGNEESGDDAKNQIEAPLDKIEEDVSEDENEESGAQSQASTASSSAKLGAGQKMEPSLAAAVESINALANIVVGEVRLMQEQWCKLQASTMEQQQHTEREAFHEAVEEQADTREQQQHNESGVTNEAEEEEEEEINTREQLQHTESEAFETMEEQVGSRHILQQELQLPIGTTQLELQPDLSWVKKRDLLSIQHEALHPDTSEKRLEEEPAVLGEAPNQEILHEELELPREAPNHEMLHKEMELLSGAPDRKPMVASEEVSLDMSALPNDYSPDCDYPYMALDVSAKLQIITTDMLKAEAAINDIPQRNLLPSEDGQLLQPQVLSQDGAVLLPPAVVWMGQQAQDGSQLQTLAMGEAAAAWTGQQAQNVANGGQHQFNMAGCPVPPQFMVLPGCTQTVPGCTSTGGIAGTQPGAMLTMAQDPHFMPAMYQHPLPVPELAARPPAQPMLPKMGGHVTLRPPMTGVHATAAHVVWPINTGPAVPMWPPPQACFRVSQH